MHFTASPPIHRRLFSPKAKMQAISRGVLTKRRKARSPCLFSPNFFRQFLSQAFSVLSICYQPQSFRHQKNTSNCPRITTEKYSESNLSCRKWIRIIFSADLRIRASAAVRFRLTDSVKFVLYAERWVFTAGVSIPTARSHWATFSVSCSPPSLTELKSVCTIAFGQSRRISAPMFHFPPPQWL